MNLKTTRKKRVKKKKSKKQKQETESVVECWGKFFIVSMYFGTSIAIFIKSVNKNNVIYGSFNYYFINTFWLLNLASIILYFILEFPLLKPIAASDICYYPTTKCRDVAQPIVICCSQIYNTGADVLKAVAFRLKIK